MQLFRSRFLHFREKTISASVNKHDQAFLIGTNWPEGEIFHTYTFNT